MMLTPLFARTLNMSLTAAIVISIVLIVRALLKKAPKKFSYALWAVVLFRLLCPISLTAPISLFHVLDAPTVSEGGMTTAMEYLSTELMLAQPTVSQPDADIQPIQPQLQQPVVAPVVPNAARAPITPMDLGALLWAFGAALMLIYGAVTYLSYRRNLMASLWLRDNIYLADHIGTPFVTGLLRPKIYLPSAISSSEVPYILAHEQYHIRRLDHIVKLIAYGALCIHWFNPLVWAAFILSGKDMEMSCDEAVLSQLGGEIRADYSQSLLNLALGHRIYAAAPLAFGENDTKGRVLNMANWKKPTRMVSTLCALLCIAVLTACAFNPTTDTPAPTLEGKWVMKDGGFIINNGTTYDIYYTFRADGTGEIFHDVPEDHTAPGIDSVFSYVLGETDTLTITIEGRDTAYTYVLDGNILTLDSKRFGEMALTRVPEASDPRPVDESTEIFRSSDGSVEFRWSAELTLDTAEIPVLVGTLHDMTSGDARHAAAAFFSEEARFFQAPQGMEAFLLKNDLTQAVPTSWALTKNYEDNVESSTDLNMVVLDGDTEYVFSTIYNRKNYEALSAEEATREGATKESGVYGGTWRNSSIFIHSDDIQQKKDSKAPTAQELQAVLDTAAQMLTELNMGGWEIVNYFVRHDSKWTHDPKYNIGVVAAPVYEGVTATLDVLSGQDQTCNSHTSLAYLLFDIHGNIQTVWLYNPMEITGKRTDLKLMTSQVVMDVAKAYLQNEGYYKFKHLPDTDGTVIAEITNAEICYRREYGSDETKPFNYEYVPYVLFYGNAGQLPTSVSFDYTSVYPDADEGMIPLFAVSAKDGTIIQAAHHIIVQ